MVQELHLLDQSTEKSIIAWYVCIVVVTSISESTYWEYLVAFVFIHKDNVHKKLFTTEDISDKYLSHTCIRSYRSNGNFLYNSRVSIFCFTDHISWFVFVCISTKLFSITSSFHHKNKSTHWLLSALTKDLKQTSPFFTLSQFFW